MSEKCGQYRKALEILSNIDEEITKLYRLIRILNDVLPSSFPPISPDKFLKNLVDEVNRWRTAMIVNAYEDKCLKWSME